ncbi:unnamed protein product [marine sediment metagenome]|uniref:Uncharacterized protein n=1 Tax=marine sediment metagenome TaxID=412755 RepID=X1I2G6_9ZZZZ
MTNKQFCGILKKNKYSQSEPRNIFNDLTNYREPGLRSLKHFLIGSLFYLYKKNIIYPVACGALGQDYRAVMRGGQVVEQ